MAITTIQKLWDYGHFSNPAFPNTLAVESTDLDALDLGDDVVRDAVASFQDFMGHQLEPLVMKYHGRAAVHDGVIGEATRELIRAPRCGAPDYRREALPAVGNGNWPRCHGVGDFHAATVAWDTRNIPSFLAPLFDQVWERVVASYAELGLRWIRDDDDRNANIQASFVNRSSGWIGLAIVGRGQSCGDSIWCRYLNSYRGGRSESAIVTQWTTLIKHELGHNCGLEHSRGGVMNPSIVNNLPVSWDGDPSESLLNRWFGGDPVDTPGPDPGPGPGPDGPRVVLDGRLSVVIPENVKPGTYDFITVPRPEV